MAKVLPPGIPHSGWRSDAVVINTTIDADAAEILRRYPPTGRKGMGKSLARLLSQREARIQERQRLRMQLMNVFEDMLI